MFEKFTDRARMVMALANQEAQRFNHEYVGTEHILLGLVKEGSGVGAVVLKNMDVDLRKVRLEVVKLVRSGTEMVTVGKLPLVPRAKNVIEYAIEEARKLDHNYVGTEHLLLGLLRDQDGVAVQVLLNLGLNLEEIREEVLNMLTKGFEGPSAAYSPAEVLLGMHERTPNIYERFTDRARKVMALANQEAQKFNHEYLGTEHILLGLVKEGSGVGATVLKNLHIDLRKVRREVEKLVKSGPEIVTMGKLPWTPRAKKVIECAVEEARNLGHNYVGTEHLLLGLLREQDGVAAHVLTNLGLRLEEARAAVLNLVGAVVDSGIAAESLAESEVAVSSAETEKLEKFTKRVRMVFALSEQEARWLNHERIGTTHLLLGLVKEADGAAACVLKGMGVDSARARMEVEKVVPRGPAVVTARKLPLTPEAEKVLEQAIEESQRLGDQRVGTARLLVALLDEPDGAAARVLMNLGLKLDEVREATLKEAAARAAADKLARLCAEYETQIMAWVSNAFQEARRMGQPAKSSGHLLLLMLQAQEHLPATALKNLGVKVEDLVAEVKRLLAEGT